VGGELVSAQRQPEAAFLDSVLALARLRGWRCHHQRPAMTRHGWRSPISGDAGWPDLVMARPPRLVLAELKTARGRLSDDQRIWLELLAGCPGVEAHVWWPAQWAEIEAALR
jgi:hypothetical protein